MNDLSRRSLITGLISLVAAPAIVRAGSLMPVKLLEASMRFTSYGVGEAVYFQNRMFWIIGPQTVAFSDISPVWGVDPLQWGIYDS
jgi:hypothetical protein